MWNFSSATRKGDKRSVNQDRSNIVDLANGHVAIVCDGHGFGNYAVDFCVKALSQKLFHIRPETAQEQLMAIFKEVGEEASTFDSGTTASVACLWNNGKVHTAVLGDSMIVAGNPKRAHRQLSSHHNVRTNLSERSAAEARGGKYQQMYLYNPKIRNSGGLQLGRAFGDYDLLGVLSTQPDLMRFTAESGTWVVVMSDGIYDPSVPSRGKDMEELGLMMDKGATAEDLVAHFQPNKGDDATAVVARFT